MAEAFPLSSRPALYRLPLSTGLSRLQVEASRTQDGHQQYRPREVDGPGSPLGGLFPIIMMIAIFYFVLIRPQNKERKAHEGMVAALQKGDRVVTKSGVHGRIDSVGEQTVELEIADKVRVTIDKMSVARKDMEV